MVCRSVLASVPALCICAAAPAGNIVIRNGSFEANWLGDFSWQQTAPDEWYAGGDGPDDVGYQNAPSTWLTPEAIDGGMSAYIDGVDGSFAAWLAQDLETDSGAAVLAADGLLVDLAFYVGRKNGHPVAPVIEVILECELGGSWQTFASVTYDAGAAGLPQGQWDYVHAPLVMTGVTGSGYEGQQVTLTFFNHATHGIDYYAQGTLDAVAIIPEPASALVVMLGATALLRKRRSNA